MAEIERRDIDTRKLTTDEKKNILKQMLNNAGVTESEIQNEMVDKLTARELNDYYKKYEAVVNKFKSKKV